MVSRWGRLKKLTSWRFPQKNSYKYLQVPSMQLYMYNTEKESEETHLPVPSSSFHSATFLSGIFHRRILPSSEPLKK